LNAPGPTPSPPRHRIAIVDDHELVRRGLRELISAETDLEVCGEAADAPSALTLMRDTRPDLMVVDVILEKGSGLELIKQLRAWNPEQKILVSSMHEDELFAGRAMQAGARGYVNKQEPTERLLEAMRSILEGRIYLGSAPAAPHEPRELGRLSDRELEVLGLIGEGLTTTEIAERLQLSSKTIDSHREHIKSKLGIRTMNELVRVAISRLGHTGPPPDEP
jgi:DNA-binding NarL/FixJ family response regulator